MSPRSAAVHPVRAVPPRRCSAAASSSAKNGLPPEVSQSLSNVGRGNVASRRVAEQLVRRPDAQASDLDRREPRLGQGATQPGRRLAAHREQGDDADVVETRYCKPSRHERCGVEPLEVVDRQADRCLGSEQSERREEGRSNGPLVDARVRLAEQQRRLERAALDRRQLRKDDVGHAAEKIGEPGIGEPRLGLGGSGRHDSVAASRARARRLPARARSCRSPPRRGERSDEARGRGSRDARELVFPADQRRFMELVEPPSSGGARARRASARRASGRSA